VQNVFSPTATMQPTQIASLPGNRP